MTSWHIVGEVNPRAKRYRVEAAGANVAGCGPLFLTRVLGARDFEHVGNRVDSGFTMDVLASRT